MITINITIIDIVLKFIVEEKIPEAGYNKINYDQLLKKIIISVELVGCHRMKRIESFNYNNRSILK